MVVPDPIVPLVNAPAPAAPSPAAPTTVGGSPQVAAPVTPAAAVGAPAAGTPVPAPAAQPTPTTPAAPVAPVVDPRDARIAELTSQVQQYEPYARIGYEEFQKRNAPAPAAPAASPTVKPIFNITPFDEGLKSFIAYDDKGQVIEKQGAPPGTAAAYQRHINDKAAALDQFLRDPMAVLAPMLEGVQSKAAELAEKNLQGRVQEAQQQQTEAEIFAQNKTWLCQLDAAGNPLQSIDPLTRQANFHFTEDGRAFLQQYQQLTRYGVPPKMAADNAKSYVAFQRAQQEMARQAAAGGTPAAAAPPASPLQQPAAAAPVDPRRTFLASLPGGSPQGNQPSPDVSMPTGPVRAQSARQFFMDRARAAGMNV